MGKYLDTSLIKTDLQPRYIRLLIKGRLLQLNLPVEVRRWGGSRYHALGYLWLLPHKPQHVPVQHLCWLLATCDPPQWCSGVWQHSQHFAAGMCVILSAPMPFPLHSMAQVCPDAATAQRSRCSGKLVITMPKEAPDQRVTDVTHLR